MKNTYTIQSQYSKNSTKKKSVPFRVEKGVRQGDPLLPKLFFAVLESIFRRLNWEHFGINVDGVLLSNLRFVNDIVLLARTLEDVRKIVKWSYPINVPFPDSVINVSGHSSKNCSNQARRVTYLGDHGTVQCTRDKDTDGLPACVLCKSSHTANYLGCPSASKRAPVPQKNSLPSAIVVPRRPPSCVYFDAELRPHSGGTPQRSASSNQRQSSAANGLKQLMLIISIMDTNELAILAKKYRPAVSSIEKSINRVVHRICTSHRFDSFLVLGSDLDFDYGSALYNSNRPALDSDAHAVLNSDHL
ncbi:hypothetical protein EVAR_55108_1 [Eumeta japonica]|uniref:Reverse transcriptase domain-containing protein n=1 Tax=Eumeta variegata TaxID=151549 RepID=A0A4C1YFK5_EUMVA|nr:hypothetical protein EVAR_55108_1 [Eumeta japonica]